MRVSRRDFLGASALALAGASQEPEPVIDIHQHASYGGTRGPDGQATKPGRSDEDLIAHQRAMGVTRTILLPAGRDVRRDSTHQGQANGLQSTCAGNEACHRLAKAQPALFSFGANEVPDLPDAAETVEKYLKLGAVVIGEQKFGVDCDSPEMRRMYALAESRGVPVLMHWQYGMYNHGFERFSAILEQYPKVNFIGHAQTWWANVGQDHKDPSVLYPRTKVAPGGWTDRYLRDFPNMYGDLSASSGRGALSRDEGHAREFLARHQDKLLFGSDCGDTLGRGEGCVGAGILALIRRLAPDKGVERKLLYENARKLFRL